MGSESKAGAPGAGSPAFDRRTLLLAAVPVVLAAAALGALLISVAGRMPDPVASHWSGSGPADGFTSFAATAWMGVAVTLGIGLLLAVCFSLNVLGSGVRRAGVAATLLFTVFMAMIFLAGLIPQIGQSSAKGTLMDWTVVWTGLGIAAVPAVVLALLVPSRPLQACDAGLPKDAHVDTVGARRGDVIRCWVRAGTVTFVVVGALLLVSFGLLALISLWWLVGAVVLTAVVLSLLTATVTADADGLSVRVLGRWRMIHVAVPAYGSAISLKVLEPMSYGGWGYRVGSWGSAFVVGRGPGLVLTVAGGREFAVNTDTVENAERMAALLNGYKNLSAGQGADGGLGPHDGLGGHGANGGRGQHGRPHA